MYKSIWDILGIAPTQDKTEIKKAYSLKTKTIHPEEDPEGFKELNNAYKAAINSISPQDIRIPSANENNHSSASKKKASIRKIVDNDDETILEKTTNDSEIDFKNLEKTYHKKVALDKYIFSLEKEVYRCTTDNVKLDFSNWDNIINSNEFKLFTRNIDNILVFLNMIVKYKEHIILPDILLKTINDISLKHQDNNQVKELVLTINKYNDKRIKQNPEMLHDRQFATKVYMDTVKDPKYDKSDVKINLIFFRNTMVLFVIIFFITALFYYMDALIHSNFITPNKEYYIDPIIKQLSVITHFISALLFFVYLFHRRKKLRIIEPDKFHRLVEDSYLLELLVIQLVVAIITCLLLTFTNGLSLTFASLGALAYTFYVFIITFIISIHYLRKIYDKSKLERNTF